jgi:hypothetical protein
MFKKYNFVNHLGRFYSNVSRQIKENDDPDLYGMISFLQEFEFQAHRLFKISIEKLQYYCPLPCTKDSKKIYIIQHHDNENIITSHFKINIYTTFDLHPFHENYYFKCRADKRWYVISFDKIIFTDDDNNANYGLSLFLISISTQIRNSIKTLIDTYDITKSFCIFKVYVINELCEFSSFVGNTPKFANHKQIKALTDEELLKLFNEEPSTKPTKKNKKKTQKYKRNLQNTTTTNTTTIIIEKDEITNDEITNDEITNDEITNDEITNDEITNDEITNDEITNDKITNKVILLNEIDKHYQFSFNLYQPFKNKKYIIALINNLFDNNEKFRSLMNEYNYIRILKDLHTDLNELKQSIHFNIQLYNTITLQKSSVLHAYICPYDDRIISLTMLVDLI